MHDHRPGTLRGCGKIPFLLFFSLQLLKGSHLKKTSISVGFFNLTMTSTPLVFGLLQGTFLKTWFIETKVPQTKCLDFGHPPKFYFMYFQPSSINVDFLYFLYVLYFLPSSIIHQCLLSVLFALSSIIHHPSMYTFINSFFFKC